MRTTSHVVAAIACLVVAAYSAPADEPKADPTSSASDDVWADVSDELVVQETIPSYDYPENFYETPAKHARRRAGRWAADFEGSLFQDGETGEILTTTGVDDKLMAFVEVGDSRYDWDGCLDVVILAAEAKYPSPFRGGEWLIVRDVRSAKVVSGRTRVGDECLDLERFRQFLSRE